MPARTAPFHLCSKIISVELPFACNASLPSTDGSFYITIEGEPSAVNALMGSKTTKGLFSMSPGDLPIFDQTDHGIKLIEEERRRIARDLHDGPAQAITNVSMRLDIIRRLLQTQPALVEEEVDRLQQKVRVLVSDVRRLIYDLRPVAVDEVGVLQATLQLCERNQHDWNLKIEVSVQEDVSLDIAPARQVAIYRLIQELLNNVHKHAEATNVKITFAQSKSDLIIQVADNGKGFDPDLIPEGHYGLGGMKERIEYLDGTFLIESAPGTGARFEIRLPVYE